MITSKTVLTDNFGRKHNYLRISLIEKCNLRCTYCMPADGIPLSPKKELMTADEIFQMAEIFVKHGVDKIRLTGGEPLLRKDFPEICSKLASLKVNLSITTNGILIDRYISILKENNIQTINLSLDTLIASKFHTITLRDQFEKVMSNIQLLLANDFKVKINVVLMRDFNEDEIIDFIKLTQFLPLSIRFIEFMPFAGNDWDKSKMISEKEILKKATTFFSDENVLQHDNEKNYTARNFSIKGYAGSFGVISSITNPFCDGCNRIRLTANGKIKNCLFSNTETDLLTPFRNGESLPELISNCLKNKYKTRSGMTSDAEMNDPELHFDNRSMIAIGG